MPRSSSVFQQSRPVLITSLVNKSGSIGLSLLPMILVEHHYSTTQSSLVMSTVKGTTLVAILASGWASDVLGLRTTVLVGFLLATLGLALLPLSLGLGVLLLSGVTAQFGITAINATMRLLITKTVERHHHKEALGWMRLVNNLGQILSYGLAALASLVSATLGTRVLIWFDALTSLAAFGLGRKILPRPREIKEVKTSPAATAREAGGGWPIFVACALLLTGWNFMYEFFMSGVAGKLKILYPDSGLRLFSLLIVLNTFICAALAVHASRVLTRVVPSLLLGVLLSTAGTWIAISLAGSVPALFVGILFLTLGEVVYGALGQFLLIRAVPPSRRENTVYSSAILLANLGRMAAAGLAFPWVVYAPTPGPAIVASVGVGAFSVGILAVSARGLKRLSET